MKTNNYIRVFFLFVAFLLALTKGYCQNCEINKGNVIPLVRLPDVENGISYGWERWVNAGSSALLSGINIGECIIATEHGIFTGEEYAIANSINLNQIISKTNGSYYTMIYFPAGAYFFNNSIDINKDKVIFKGAGGADAPNQTHFHFNLPDPSVNLSDEPWVTNSCIIFGSDYIGFEDIYLIQDPFWVENDKHKYDRFSTNTIAINGSNCWVRGVESAHTRKHHIEIQGENNTISGCYFHDAEWYVGGGRAYGVTLNGYSKSNVIENNIFNHLRHSIVLQCGPKYNVVGYNYSANPYSESCDWFLDDWHCCDNSGRVPDICFHGSKFGDPPNEVDWGGATYNLIEGNICEKIRFDDVHKENGPYNTFFRNWAKGEVNGPWCVDPEAQDPFSIMHTASDDQFMQNIVACNAMPSFVDWEKICEHGFFAYWYEKRCYDPEDPNCDCITTHSLDSKLGFVPSDLCSYYKTAKPDFWNGYDVITWPYYPTGENPALLRNWRADQQYPDVTKAIYVGWDPNFYLNMCGPCIFIEKDINQSPAIQNFFQSVGNITASYAILTSSPVTFISGDYIDLDPGFETYDGGEFEAYIDEVSCPENSSKIIQHQPLSANTQTKNELGNDSISIDDTYFKVSPNPTNGDITLSYNFNENTDVLFEIYNTQGVKECSYSLSGSVNSKSISLVSLNNGIYTYRAIAGNKLIATDKIVVIK